MSDSTPPRAAGAHSPRVTLTEAAAHFVASKLAEEGRPGAALRVAVKGGGCNGLKYVLEYTSDPPRPRDLCYEFFGTRVLVDTKSADFIDGAVVDYERTLMYRGLRVHNPQEASRCGCGETFSVGDDVYERRRARALPTTG